MVKRHISKSVGLACEKIKLAFFIGQEIYQNSIRFETQQFWITVILLKWTEHEMKLTIFKSNAMTINKQQFVTIHCYSRVEPKRFQEVLSNTGRQTTSSTV